MINKLKSFSIATVLMFFILIGVNAQETANNLSAVGMKLFESGQHMDAIVNFNKAIEIDNQYYQAFFMRGVIKQNFEDHHGAMKDFNRAIELNDKLSEAYFHRGNIKFLLQDYYGSIDDYTKTISLNDGHIEAYFKRGLAKQQLEAYQEAIHDCSRILEINPKNVDAYFLRGILRIEHGQLEGGCLDLSKAGELGDIKAYEVIKEKCNQKCFMQEF